MSDEKIQLIPFGPTLQLDPCHYTQYRVPTRSAEAAVCQHTNFVRPRSSCQFCIEDCGLKVTSISQDDWEANPLSKMEHLDKFPFRFVISFLFSTLLILDRSVTTFLPSGNCHYNIFHLLFPVITRISSYLDFIQIIWIFYSAKVSRCDPTWFHPNRLI